MEESNEREVVQMVPMQSGELMISSHECSQ